MLKGATPQGALPARTHDMCNGSGCGVEADLAPDQGPGSARSRPGREAAQRTLAGETDLQSSVARERGFKKTKPGDPET